MVDYTLVAVVNSAGRRKGHVISDADDINNLDDHARKRFVRVAAHPGDVPFVSSAPNDEPADPAEPSN